MVLYNIIPVEFNTGLPRDLKNIKMINTKYGIFGLTTHNMGGVPKVLFYFSGSRIGALGLNIMGGGPKVLFLFLWIKNWGSGLGQATQTED